ncbi:MAG TPA: hypothetical protein VHC70_02725 [Phycisphaerales bacterium]|nr:hypothetical protein [Phycisphaerales bacterium]
MRVLLDHCVPRPFGRLLVGHEVATTFEMGWAKLFNGALLAAAVADNKAAFNALVTVDRNLSFQQNKAELPLPVIAMIAPDNKPETLAMLAPAVLKVLDSRPARRVYVVGAQRRPKRRGQKPRGRR